MCDVGIASHIAIKVHNISHTSAIHHLGFVCGMLRVENISYIDYNAKFAASSVLEEAATEHMQLQRQLLWHW